MYHRNNKKINQKNLYNKMIQQQKLENAIDFLNGSDLSPMKTLKCLKIVAKALSEYTSNPDTLPPETLIPCALFSVPNKLFAFLKMQKNQFLYEKPQKMSSQLLLQFYLKSVLKLGENSSQEISHVIVEGMSRCVNFLIPFPKVQRKWLKYFIHLWSASTENLNIPLRCHLALSKYLSYCNNDSYMWALRRLYVSFFQNCQQVSWKNYEHINFMINSLCQIIKINADRSYYVLFGYLRSISLQLDKLNKVKKKEKIALINKLFSNQILNCFKLFSMIVCRVQNQEMTALIYPLCELIAAYERVTQSPQFIPLKLHLLQCELKIMQGLHIYIPHSLELIKKIMNCSIFNKKLSKKGEKVEANIQIAYKLSTSELSQSALLNELFKSLMTKVYMFEGIVSRNIGGAEVVGQLYRFIKQKQFVFSGYKEQQRECYKMLKEDHEVLKETRKKMKLGFSDNKGIEKFENKMKNKKLKGLDKYYQLKQQEEDVLKTKLAAQNDDQNKSQEDQSNSQIQEDDDEVNSGWEEASQGASEYDYNEKNQEEEEKEDNEVEEVSYEGDPEDIDEAVKVWEEEEWDSQNDIQN